MQSKFFSFLFATGIQLLISVLLFFFNPVFFRKIFYLFRFSFSAIDLNSGMKWFSLTKTYFFYFSFSFALFISETLNCVRHSIDPTHWTWKFAIEFWFTSGKCFACATTYTHNPRFNININIIVNAIIIVIGSIRSRIHDKMKLNVYLLWFFFLRVILVKKKFLCVKTISNTLFICELCTFEIKCVYTVHCENIYFFFFSIFENETKKNKNKTEKLTYFFRVSSAQLSNSIIEWNSSDEKKKKLCVWMCCKPYAVNSVQFVFGTEKNWNWNWILKFCLSHLFGSP